jgi:hypothetical protein
MVASVAPLEPIVGKNEAVEELTRCHFTQQFIANRNSA